MTLGEIAYNAYCHAVEWKSVKGDPLPQFIEQFPRLKIAWEAAAGAVLAEAAPPSEIFRDVTNKGEKYA
jgi:hypothetical protein